MPGIVEEAHRGWCLGTKCLRERLLGNEDRGVREVVGLQVILGFLFYYPYVGKIPEGLSRRMKDDKI